MMTFSSTILITNEKLKPLPTRKWMHQVGRLDGKGPEKQAYSYPRCRLRVYLWAAFDYPTWPLRHTRDMSVMECPEHSVTTHQYSPSHQQQGLAYT